MMSSSGGNHFRANYPRNSRVGKCSRVRTFCGENSPTRKFQPRSPTTPTNRQISGGKIQPQKARRHRQTDKLKNYLGKKFKISPRSPTTPTNRQISCGQISASGSPTTATNRQTLSPQPRKPDDTDKLWSQTLSPQSLPPPRVNQRSGV